MPKTTNNWIPTSGLNYTLFITMKKFPYTPNLFINYWGMGLRVIKILSKYLFRLCLKNSSHWHQYTTTTEVSIKMELFWRLLCLASFCCYNSIARTEQFQSNRGLLDSWSWRLQSPGLYCSIQWGIPFRIIEWRKGWHGERVHIPVHNLLGQHATRTLTNWLIDYLMSKYPMTLSL